MGICFRIVLVGGDEQPRRFPLARYERLFDGDPATRMVEFAGKRIRCACVAVDFMDRVPIQVVHCSYSFLHFDDEGRIDLGRQHEAMQLAAEMVIGPVLAPTVDGVLKAPLCSAPLRPRAPLGTSARFGAGDPGRGDAVGGIGVTSTLAPGRFGRPLPRPLGLDQRAGGRRSPTPSFPPQP